MDFLKLKSKLEKLQTGGILNPKDFYKNYINSPNYKTRLSKMGHNDPSKVIKDRNANLNKTDVSYINGIGSQYMHDENTIVIDNKEAKKFNLEPNQVLAHEYSHALGARSNDLNINPSLKLNKIESNAINYRNLLNKTKSPQNPRDWAEWNHDKRAHEAKADIDALRFQLKKDKVYDTGTQDFTPQLLKKAKEKYSKDFIMNRTFKTFKDNDLIWLMNNVAKNKSTNTQNIG